ncbi:MAG: hypothetical protein ACRDRI_00445 [Pseudonocardiaceae bacterium]
MPTSSASGPVIVAGMLAALDTHEGYRVLGSVPEPGTTPRRGQTTTSGDGQRVPGCQWRYWP